MLTLVGIRGSPCACDRSLDFIELAQWMAPLASVLHESVPTMMLASLP